MILVLIDRIEIEAFNAIKGKCSSTCGCVGDGVKHVADSMTAAAYQQGNCLVFLLNGDLPGTAPILDPSFELDVTWQGGTYLRTEATSHWSR